MVNCYEHSIKIKWQLLNPTYVSLFLFKMAKERQQYMHDFFLIFAKMLFLSISHCQELTSMLVFPENIYKIMHTSTTKLDTNPTVFNFHY